MINTNEELRQACAILKKRNTANAQTVVRETGWDIDKAKSVFDELASLGVLGEVTIADRRRVMKTELEEFISVEPVDEPAVPAESAENVENVGNVASAEVVVTERVKFSAPLAGIKASHIKNKKRGKDSSKSLDEIIKDLESRAVASVFTGDALLGKIHEVVEDIRHQVDKVNVGLAALRKLKGCNRHLTVEAYDPSDKADGGIIVRDGPGREGAIVYIYWEREPTLKYFQYVRRMVEGSLKDYLLRCR